MPNGLLNSEKATAPAVRRRPPFPLAVWRCVPAVSPSNSICRLLCATVLIRRLFQFGCALVTHRRRGPSADKLQKMDTRNCNGHRDPSSQQHRGCRQCTDGEAKQQRLYDGGVHQMAPAAVKGNSKRRRLRFKNSKAAGETEASPSQRTRRRAFFRSRTRREILAREWGKLGSAIRRAAAVCLAPSTGAADEDDELIDRLPYVQLDKVTRTVSREAFGPLYLVT